jgi:predicted phosphodiesterase
VPYLILSDLHSNREALEAVIQDAQGLYDRMWCLGDIVGYGADPNFTAEWVREHATAAIRGNHDKMCVGLEDPEGHNQAARVAAEWTRTQLTSANTKYLAELPRGPLRVENVDLVHGSPLDEDEYLIHAGDVAQALEGLDAQVTFFGHTHIQGGFLVARGGIRRIIGERVLELEPDHMYLINPGSVGQPRDANPRAAYAIYTPENRTVEYRRVKYDIQSAAQKILDAGLPSILAGRLYEGA